MIRNCILSIITALIAQITFGAPTLDDAMNGYFKSQNIHWNIIKKEVHSRCEKWEIPVDDKNMGVTNYTILNSIEEKFELLETGDIADKVVREVEKIEGLYLEVINLDPELFELPEFWWFDIIEETQKGTQLYENTKTLKHQADKGPIHPITIGQILLTNLTPEDLNQKGMEKLLVCMIYPFYAPTEQNLAARQVEYEISDEFQTIFQHYREWSDVHNSFMKYLNDNYAIETEGLRDGEKILHVLDGIGQEKFEFVKWKNDKLKNDLIATGFIQNGETNFQKITELIAPIVEKNEHLYPFHAVKGALDASKILAITEDHSFPVLAGAMRVNFSAIDIEKEFYQKLLFLLIAGELFE